MEPRGCNPVAISRKSDQRGSRKNKPKRLPWVATGCPRRSMVRSRRFESVRGLCKRPAQRPLIAQSHLLLVQHAVGMEPFMEPSGRKLLLRLGPRALSRSYRKPPKSR